MQTVKPAAWEIPPFGLFVRRKWDIKCGKCRHWFKDKPEHSYEIICKCPYCNALNKMPFTKN
jgi:hypothetical protein